MEKNGPRIELAPCPLTPEEHACQGVYLDKAARAVPESETNRVAALAPTLYCPSN